MDIALKRKAEKNAKRKKLFEKQRRNRMVNVGQIEDTLRPLTVTLDDLIQQSRLITTVVLGLKQALEDKGLIAENDINASVNKLQARIKAEQKKTKNPKGVQVSVVSNRYYNPLFF